MSSLSDRAALIVRHTPACSQWLVSVGFKPPAILKISRNDDASVYLVKRTKLGLPIEERMILEREWERIADLEWLFLRFEGFSQPPMKCLEDFENYFSWEYVEIVDLETLPPRGSDAERNKS